MKKIIYAMCITLILGCIPFMAAMAAGNRVKAGDKLVENPTDTAGGDGIFYVEYKASGGKSQMEPSVRENGNCTHTVMSLWGFTEWDASRITDDQGKVTKYTLTAVEGGKSDKKRRESTPTSWLDNPDEITAFYIVNNSIDPKAKFGKQEQGDACKAAFARELPAGWKQAFTFSMSYDDKHTTDLKDGTLQMYIPAGYQKAGRKYGVMAIDKYGKVHTYYDSDLQDGLLTAKLGFEGYAFSLIYMD